MFDVSSRLAHCFYILRATTKHFTTAHEQCPSPSFLRPSLPAPPELTGKGFPDPRSYTLQLLAFGTWYILMSSPSAVWPTCEGLTATGPQPHYATVCDRGKSLDAQSESRDSQPGRAPKLKAATANHRVEADFAR